LLVTAAPMAAASVWSVLFAAEIEEKEQQSNVEGSIEEPSIHPGTSVTLEMQPQSSHRGDEAEDELHNLEIGDQFLPERRTVDAAEKVVSVHDHMDRGVGEKSDDLKRLHELEPEVAHDDDRGVMKHMEKSKGSSLEDQDESIEKLVELAQVVDIRPKKHRTCCSSPLRKTQNPVCATSGTP
jgi:hypothetical protein